ncbi:MAG: hypothetical protein ACREOZ_00130 [Gloeomargaritales cyanobacterium]
MAKTSMSVRAKSKIQLPGPSNRTVVIGRTGSGKSHFGAWLLSTQNFDSMPWVIIDFKDEHTDIINQIERAIPIGFDTIPDRPGIYILKPMSHESAELEQWLWKVYYHTNIGLFFDEAFPVGQHNEAFNTILMQGRSKNIPVIACTQRPVGISVYCFSEASYYMIFDLTKKGDRIKVSQEIGEISSRYNLPDYHSYYYDVKNKYLDKLGPAPDEKLILAKIDVKIPVQRRTL